MQLFREERLRRAEARRQRRLEYLDSAEVETAVLRALHSISFSHDRLHSLAPVIQARLVTLPYFIPLRVIRRILSRVTRDWRLSEQPQNARQREP